MIDAGLPLRSPSSGSRFRGDTGRSAGHGSRYGVLALAALASLPWGSLVSATEVTLRLDPPMAWVGETISLQVQVTDPPRGVRYPEMPDVPGVKIVGPGAASQRTEIVNGRGSYWISFPYEATPAGNGGEKYTLGPALVQRAAGPPLQSNTIELRVFRRPPPGLRFECKVTPEKVTLGSPVRVVYTAYFSEDFETLRGLDLPILELSQVRVTPIAVDPKLEATQVQVSREQAIILQQGFADLGDGYGSYTLSFGFDAVPLATGRLELGEGRVVVRLRTGRSKIERDGFFGQRRVAEVKEYQASAARAAIVVGELPEAGRPRSFNGALGRYAFSITASPTEVNSFDPITLEMTVKGDGNLERLPPPPLAELPELRAGFDVATDVDTGKIAGRTKVFRQVVRPLNEKVTEIPRLPFAFYDPASGYREVFSDAIPIKVRAVKTVGGEDAIRSAAAPTAAGEARPTTPTIAAIASQAGIGANYDRPGAARPSLDPRREVLSGSFLTLLAAPPALFLGALALRRRGRRDPAAVRREAALARARKRLAASDPIYEAASLAYQDYFRERFTLPPGELTPAELSAVLERGGAAADLRARARDLLEQILAGRFGGARESAAALGARASEVLREVERCG